MEVPGKVLTISKVEGARRQVEEAIKALERGDFDIAITLAGAAEGMLETTDLSAAVRKEAEAAGVSSEDPSDALGWLNYPGGAENHAFSGDLAVEMIMYTASKIDRASWTPLMNEFEIWLFAQGAQRR